MDRPVGVIAVYRKRAADEKYVELNISIKESRLDQYYPRIYTVISQFLKRDDWETVG